MKKHVIVGGTLGDAGDRVADAGRRAEREGGLLRADYDEIRASILLDAPAA
jgi:hypothetical protein